MKAKIYVLVAQSITSWLYKISYSNHLYLRDTYTNFEVITINILSYSELEYYEDVIRFPYNPGFITLLVDCPVTRKYQHAYLLDKGIEEISSNISNDDKLIICDSDFVISNLHISWIENPISFFSERPVNIYECNNRKSFPLPHPCFITFTGSTILRLIFFQKKFSFKRRRDTNIGLDWNKKSYGADSLDFVMFNLLSEAHFIRKVISDSYHFEGCTEIIRKYKKEKNDSIISEDIIFLAQELDKCSTYHDGNSNYYTKGLYSTINIRNIEFYDEDLKHIQIDDLFSDGKICQNLPTKQIIAVCKKIEMRLTMRHRQLG